MRPVKTLLRLFEFLLERAETAGDFDPAQRAIDAITEAVEGHLGRTPFIFRKAGASPFQRELVIPFGHGGYVALCGPVRDRRRVHGQRAGAAGPAGGWRPLTR
jgi:hypothetical protein